MASQEFLASFAVEIDEGGVTRLQSILEQNRELADSVAAAGFRKQHELRDGTCTLDDLPDIAELIRARSENEKRAAEAARA